MKITVDKAKKLKCPVCKRTMEYNLPVDISSYRDTDVQRFECECGLRHTIWGLQVTGLQKEYDKINKLRRQIYENT